MKRFILTGAPGAGKTSILCGLQRRGWSVVEEAATYVIAREQALGRDEPWRGVGFLDKIVALQRQRQQLPVAPSVGVQFFDRSPFCTVALARYLSYPVTATLASEIVRVIEEQVFQRTVFFVRPIGFVAPTAARKISYQNSLVFEAMHEAVYQEHGFAILDVAAAAVEERIAAIEAHVAQQAGADRR